MAILAIMAPHSHSPESEAYRECKQGKCYGVWKTMDSKRGCEQINLWTKWYQRASERVPRVWWTYDPSRKPNVKQTQISRKRQKNGKYLKGERRIAAKEPKQKKTRRIEKNKNWNNSRNKQNASKNQSRNRNRPKEQQKSPAKSTYKGHPIWRILDKFTPSKMKTNRFKLRTITANKSSEWLNPLNFLLLECDNFAKQFHPIDRYVEKFRLLSIAARICK